MQLSGRERRAFCCILLWREYKGCDCWITHHRISKYMYVVCTAMVNLQ